MCVEGGTDRGGIRRDLLDHGNVDGGSSARRVDLGVGHYRDIMIPTEDERGVLCWSEVPMLWEF